LRRAERIPWRLLIKVIASDHTAVEIPRNLARHADGQRLGREPAAFLAYCERASPGQRKPK
jgi:hypothetical protein